MNIVLDPNTAGLTPQDNFVKFTSALGITAPVQIVGGQIALQFSADSSTVAGSAFLVGNALAGTNAWEATFTGTATQLFTGYAEQT